MYSVSDGNQQSEEAAQEPKWGGGRGTFDQRL